MGKLVVADRVPPVSHMTQMGLPPEAAVSSDIKLGLGSTGSMPLAMSAAARK